MQGDKGIVLNIRQQLMILLAPYLGQYKLVNGDLVPSIAVYILGNQTVPTYKMVEGSGVECIIEPQSQTDFRHSKFDAVNLVRRFMITLDQHDATQTLDECLEKIFSCPGLRPLEQPVIRPRMQSPNQQGEIPARAMLYVVNTEYLSSLI